MSKIIFFAHMMKTAGTSLTKSMIEHFGPRMHIVPGGLSLDSTPYNPDKLLEDNKKFNHQLRFVTGHLIRPFVDFGTRESEIEWFAFVRNPEKRFVSNYLHDLNWTSYFQNNPGKTIVEWEKIRDYSNYQVRFLAGEPNLQKAIDLLHAKVKIVGITEQYDKSICLIKNCFHLDDLFINHKRSNTSLSDKEFRDEVFEEYADFISEANHLDSKLYQYVLDEIWPNQTKMYSTECSKSGKNWLVRSTNMGRFQIKRYSIYKPTKLKWSNMKRFYKRWYK